MNRSLRVSVVVAVLALLVAVPARAQTRAYKILATNKTSTMEKELKEAGALGYRFLAVMGGDTGFGGSQAVVLLERDKDDKSTYNFRLLATNRTSTLQKELQDAGEAGYHAVGQTVFESTFGGRETVAIVQKSSDPALAVEYEYKLVATNKTSTLERELLAVAEAGFEAIDLTVGKTAMGGNELVVITRRRIKR